MASYEATGEQEAFAEREIANVVRMSGARSAQTSVLLHKLW